MYQIAKEFEFCYGHRVWSQSLNCDFSLDGCLKCRHLHGHQGKLIVYLEAEQLNDGMVTDFKHLNWLKKWLDDVLDHKFIMDLNDPILKESVIFPSLQLSDLIKEDINGRDWYMTVAPWKYQNSHLATNEIYEGLVFVDFVPTSENLSKWIYDIVQEKMTKIGVRVQRVQFFETPKSQSNFLI